MFKWVAHRTASIVEQGVDTSAYAVLRAATCYHLFEFNRICENGGAKLRVANIWIGVLAKIGWISNIHTGLSDSYGIS